jgi:GNAT superfamily N-acetyltransferase
LSPEHGGERGMTAERRARRVAVAAVAARADFDAFVKLPWRLYAGDPNFVPPLLADVKKRLDPARNPFFRHAERQLFLARAHGEITGRIAAIVDRRHQEVHGDRVGFFGWFECVNDQETASALLEAAAEWLRERGCTAVRGPASSSLNEECGLLVDGFDRPPTVMMPYNPPYYATLIERAGYAKAMDLFSFYLRVNDFGIERIGRVVEKIKARERLVVRNFDLRDFKGEIRRLKAVYNDAWTDNWGFVPLTDDELDAMAHDLKPILEPKLACFVEVDGRPVGFSLVLPNLNEILRRMNGRLFPTGLLRILLGIKKVSSIRLVAMGVARDYHLRGLDAVLYENNFRRAQELRKEWSDIGWVLETNQVMVNTIERLGGRRYKTHRIFAAPIE